MAQELTKGLVVMDRYQLESPLGEGGYGAVWTATQLNVERLVAIKFLKAQMFDDAAQRRFKREANALARLQHPGCVTLIDFGQSEHGAYLVTEFLDGKELSDWLQEGERPLVELLDVATQILKALQHAHEERIIHRDLKPANIIMTRSADGRPFVKVLDFGIASVAGSKRGDITKTGDVFGTPGYMSPEQLLGEEDVGPSADLYAFGVMLYQMLERKRLFDGDSAIEMSMKHLTHPAPPLSPQYPPALNQIVQRCLQKEAPNRFQSAEAALNALAQLEFSGSVMAAAGYAPPPGFSQPAFMQTPRHQPHTTIHAQQPRDHRLTAVAVTLLGLVVIAAVVVVWTAQVRDADGPVTVVQAPSGVSLTREAASAAKSKIPTIPPSVDAGNRNEAPYIENDAGQRVGRSGGCDAEPFVERGVSEIQFGSSSIFVFVPENYDHSRAHRAVMFIHDTNQKPTNMLRRTGMQDRAEADNVVVIMPFSENWEYPWTREPEHRYLAAVADEVAARVCLDYEQFAVFGHGSGGHGAYGDVCQFMPEAHAVIFSSWRLLNGNQPCYVGDKPIPTLMLSPTQDGRDPVKGGTGCYGGNPIMSLKEHNRRFVEALACDASSKQSTTIDDAVCTTWNCAVAFEICEIDGGRQLHGTKAQMLPDGHEFLQLGMQLTGGGSNSTKDCTTAPAKFNGVTHAWKFLHATIWQDESN